MKNFIKTNELLKVDYKDGNSTTYYTFTAPTTASPNYFYVISRKDYFVVGLYSGDYQKFYKNKKLAEQINCFTKEIRILDVDYEILENTEV